MTHADETALGAGAARLGAGQPAAGHSQGARAEDGPPAAAPAPTEPVPVIAIDGPTASGKGTVAHGVARRLGWAVLDSGALYRLTALAALERGIAPEDEAAVAEAARTLPVRFEGQHIYLDGREVGYDIRQERVGNVASRVAAYGSVRQALLDRQRAFRRAPGLVADGRDMGTVVFPDAALKIFLIADVRARAERRRKQLMEKGISANLEDLLRDMRERDARDTQRAVAPLAPAADATVLDSSKMTAQETVQAILDLWNALRNGGNTNGGNTSGGNTGSRNRGGSTAAAARGTAREAKGFSGAAGDIAPR